MTHNFKNLIVWQKSMKLVEDIYGYTSSFPKEEKYQLISQINRSALSIPSNIAEGSGRSTEKEFKHFLRIALGSSYELETQLILSKNLGMLETENFERISKDLEKVQKMLIGFSKSLKSNYLKS